MFSIFTLLLLSAASAQVVGGESSLKFQWDGEETGNHFGNSIASAGDVNGDGIGDIIVGAPFASPNGNAAVGSAFVYSGVDGTLLYRWNGADQNDYFGFSVSSAGDINGDGFCDLIVSAYMADSPNQDSAGTVYVYSGADGTLIHQLNGTTLFGLFGECVAGAGDVNGDGIPDIVIGAKRANPGGLANAGAVFVHSGANGALLYQWAGEAAGDYFGDSVSGAGDVNGDGFNDVIIGAQRPDRNGGSSSGAAYVYSGADGTLLYQWNGQYRHDYFGCSVSSAGDVDGDGFSDLIVGIQQAPAWVSPGKVHVFSGVSGNLLYELAGYSGLDYFGHSVASAGDINGDSFDDLLVGAIGTDSGGLSDTGSAYAYSGLDGSLIRQWDGTSAGGHFGHSVASAKGISGNNLPGIVIAADFADPGSNYRAGSVFVFDIQPFLYISGTSISAATGGTLQLDLDFPNAAGFDRYRILISAAGIGPTFHGVDIPLSLDAMVWGCYFGNYPFPAHSNLQGTLDAAGDASASITIPAGISSSLIGATYHVAAIANQPGQLPEFSSVALPIQITL